MIRNTITIWLIIFVGCLLYDSVKHREQITKLQTTIKLQDQQIRSNNADVNLIMETFYDKVDVEDVTRLKAQRAKRKERLK